MTFFQPPWLQSLVGSYRESSPLYVSQSVGASIYTVQSSLYLEVMDWMPIKLRPLEKITDKWSTRAAAAVTDYAEGIANPKVPWSQAAVAAKDAWRQGVTDAAGRDAFAKGVARAGDAKWLKKAQEFGPTRYPDGVSKTKDDYKNGFAPFYDALTKVELPARRARGDPANVERVKAIMTAMRSTKQALLK
jgi:hypothetical protein